MDLYSIVDDLLFLFLFLESLLSVLLTSSTMSAKSAISKEIFAPLDERMLGAVQVKRRTKKKIPFLATGGQGEYLTYICLSGNENEIVMLLKPLLFQKNLFLGEL